MAAQTQAQRPSAVSHVSAEGLAEVGLEGQVDDGVVNGGGFGKHGRPGKGHGGHVEAFTERCPHGDKRIGAPRRQEADTHCHGELGTQTQTH